MWQQLLSAPTLLAILLIISGSSQSVYAQSFANSYAIIIGADDYTKLGLSRLNNAESDARAIGRYFRAQGYKVTSLIGTDAATKPKVEEAVRKIAAGITENDRFVFFFAGHGKAKRMEGVDIAYLIVPGGRNKDDPVSLISTGDIMDYSRYLDRARHQLFIFDSCYGGLMGQFRTRDAGERLQYNSEDFLVRDLGSRRVRQYLSAGGEDQEVLDNGPAQLSWFTYFLLKGMEPGVVSQRSSGLITFSELASYVQALSANPKHTPAFGSLSGHHGGEFLLTSTAKGSPPLPALPGISKQTLRDLGFLTRSETPEQTGSDMDSMRQPVELVYQAWMQKDFDLYINQFDRGVIQTGRLKKGGSYSRDYNSIKTQREKDFARLDHVDILKYEVMYQGSNGGKVTFGVRYSMDFHWQNGKITHEHNMQECYSVRRHPTEKRWVITRNDDYQHRICYQ